MDLIMASTAESVEIMFVCTLLLLWSPQTMVER